MNIHTLFTDCISYEQLESYASDKSTKAERATVYKHISSCELCACAVNGFTATPFTSDELAAIHREIDVRTNATHKNPLTFAQVFIVLLSLSSIVFVYHFSGQGSEKVSSTKQILIPLTQLTPSANETKTELQKEISATSETVTKIMHVISNEKYQRSIIPLEELPPIRPDSLLLSDAITAVKNEGLVIPFHFNAEVIYMYDLKVTCYYDYYFSAEGNRDYLKHTPSIKENKETPDNLIEKDMEQNMQANQILKKGLEYFNRGKYTKASHCFQLLIDVNPADVNALFYQAVAFYQTGKYSKAVENLRAVLSNSNNVFHPESKWNLALVHLKMGEKQLAKQLFSEIVSERGFYAKKAAEKLKHL
ncbi:MAG: tetratricopeptide repeat protein [Bacteroidota bacterium]|nr:tetratricopeptide repeat protein [Bacteroidota bacterium]